MSTSTAYQYATGEGGIGLDAMNENIRKFFSGSSPSGSVKMRACLSAIK